MTDAVSSPRDARAGIGLFLIAALLFFCAMSGTTLPTPLYTLYRQQMDLSQAMITVIFAVYAGGVIAALVLTGRWSDQIGRKPMLYAGVGLSVASDLVFCLAGQLWLVLLARMISGLSAGIFASTATATVMDLAPPRHVKLGVLVATAANMGGLGAGPLLAGAAALLMPLPLLTPYLLHLALICLAALCFRHVPERVTKAARPDWSPQSLALPPEVRRAFLPAAIAAVAGFMVFGFYSAVIPGFLGQIMGYHSPLLIGFVAGFIFLASTLGQALVGHIGAGWRGPLGCLVLGAGTTIMAFAFQMQNLPLLLLATLVAGLGHGLAFRSGLAAIGAAAPDTDRAGVISLYFVVSYLAISVPVVIFGLLTLALPLAPLATGFAVLATALCLLALSLLIRHR
ncbi:MFS transporter [Thioclava sp. GXIMD4216]|uniref:MFS transporter n=1 Tax=Thioclava sp. GXIMD4216 TaxID=3131929 RepID=UPI0030D2AA34